MSEALRALYEGDVARAQELLPPDRELSIFEAAAFGRVERLREILDADPSQARALSDDGFTALHLAIFGDQKMAAQVLIDHGADVNRVSTSTFAQVPPLGTAAFVGSLPLAKLVLDAGADVNSHEQSGFTALHAAAENGDADLARELLSRGADPAIRTADGKTPADLAASDDLRRLLAPP